MTIAADLKILYHLALSPVRGATHAERLESFYSSQAAGYDSFRERLLQGRRELIEALPFPDGGEWIDMGGGTGANVDFLGERLSRLRQVLIVDLSPSLLAIADRRIADRQWRNVITCRADATEFKHDRAVDVVTFSYSLTMIPDWFAALERAAALLKPGGVIGVVDFHVARKHPYAGFARHAWPTRVFWPVWFGFDNVFPSADHAPYLHRRFEPISFREQRAKIPYLPLARAPYYTFIGRKRLDGSA